MGGIKHIEFWVSDLEKTLEFYRQLFALIGWQEIGDSSFSDGNTKIYFMERDTHFNDNIGPRHICFLADSREIVDKVGARLKNTKAAIIRGPLDSHYQDRISYTVDFKDPDGYILEVATTSEKSIKTTLK